MGCDWTFHAHRLHAIIEFTERIAGACLSKLILLKINNWQTEKYFRIAILFLRPSPPLAFSIDDTFSIYRFKQMQILSFLWQSTCLSCYAHSLLLSASISGDIFGIFRHIQIDSNLHIFHLNEMAHEIRVSFFFCFCFFAEASVWCVLDVGRGP